MVNVKIWTLQGCFIISLDINHFFEKLPCDNFFLLSEAIFICSIWLLSYILFPQTNENYIPWCGYWTIVKYQIAKIFSLLNSLNLWVFCWCSIKTIPASLLCTRANLHPAMHEFLRSACPNRSSSIRSCL